MAKILDANKLTGNIQKVVEAASGYIINGHYYDKTTMVPRPLKLIPTAGDATDLGMARRAGRWATAVMWQKTNGEQVVVDRYDPTITYTWSTQLRSNTITWYKMKEQNGSVDLITSNAWGTVPTTYPFCRSVVGQDVNYIYVLMECNNYNIYFGKIDKNTLAWTQISNPGTYSISTFFKENDTYIFWGYKKQYGTCYMQRYNKVSSTLETVPVTAKTGGTYAWTTNYSSGITAADNDVYFYDLCYNATTLKFYFTRYKMDMTQTTLANILTEATPNVTWGTTITQLPVPAAQYSNKFELFITTASSGKKYLNVAIQEAPNTSTAANISTFGIYTFLIDDTTRDLTFKNFVQVTTTYFRQFVGLRNHTFLACMTDDSTIFMNFDEAAEKFVQTDIMSNQPSHIGVDQSETLWIVNSLTEVDMLSPYVPTNVNIAFEKGSYKYEGVDYDSFITIEAKNYAGTNIAVNLEVTLTGNAMFKSNSSKVLTDATLVSGTKVIPITIKGAGTISAYPKLVM